tara:strand:+ start:526 stop:714 length:189 start_codon:yes stop_codon:yes gene_type:complete
MADVSLKECCRLFWMVKGHLNTSEETIRSSYNGYFKRLWYNEEAYIKEEGFEEAYKSFLDKM